MVLGGVEYPITLPRETHRGNVSTRTMDAPRRLSPWLWMESGSGLGLRKVFLYLIRRQRGGRIFYSAQDGLSGNFVNSILNQPDSLWMGTNAGISHFQKAKKTWKTYSQKEGLTETEIKSLVSVGRKMWAGGIGGSLFEYDSGSDRWKRIEPTDSLKNGGIHSMVMTKEKVFICRDNGVSIYDLSTGQWESLTVSDGLLSNTVFCAAEDKNSIWFGTDKGASRLILAP